MELGGYANRVAHIDLGTGTIENKPIHEAWARKYIGARGLGVRYCMEAGPTVAPLVNSYKRLVPGYEAPTYLTWGRTNRSALIRVPKVSPGRSIEATRAEVRCPDPTANTYLAFAAMLAAGLDGIERGLKLADPVEESLFEMSASRVRERGIREMPGNLGEAIDELEKDEVIAEALGEHVFSHYLEAKREEWDSYNMHITEWELDRYLEAY